MRNNDRIGFLKAFPQLLWKFKPWFLSQTIPFYFTFFVEIFPKYNGPLPTTCTCENLVIFNHKNRGKHSHNMGSCLLSIPTYVWILEWWYNVWKKQWKESYYPISSIVPRIWHLYLVHTYHTHTSQILMGEFVKKHKKERVVLQKDNDNVKSPNKPQLSSSPLVGSWSLYFSLKKIFRWII